MVIQPLSFQVVLASIVGIEGRAADVGGLANLVDRDRIVAPRLLQGDEGLLQQPLSTGHAAVDSSLAHFPTIFSGTRGGDRPELSVRAMPFLEHAAAKVSAFARTVQPEPARECDVTKRAASDVTPGPAGLILHEPARYDALVWLLTLGRERAFREKMLRLASLQPGETILDVGCGTGTLAIMAKQRVGPVGVVHGIDASPEMIARASRKARRAGVQINFKQGAAQELPFGDSQIDLVCTTLMLHHLPRKAREEFAREAKRVLKPNGRILAVDFGEASHVRGDLIARLHRRRGHTKIDEARSVLGAAGLNVLASGSVGSRNLIYVLASPGRPDVAPVAPNAPGNASARPGRAWKRAMVIAAGFAGAATLIAFHVGAGMTLFQAGFEGLTYPISSAIIAAVLIIGLKMALLGGLHRKLRARLGPVLHR